jgi:hypothetical protein
MCSKRFRGFGFSTLDLRRTVTALLEIRSATWLAVERAPEKLCVLASAERTCSRQRCGMSRCRNTIFMRPNRTAGPSALRPSWATTCLFSNHVHILYEGVPKVERPPSILLGFFEISQNARLEVVFRTLRPVPGQLRRQQCLERKIRWRPFQQRSRSHNTDGVGQQTHRPGQPQTIQEYLA